MIESTQSKINSSLSLEAEFPQNILKHLGDRNQEKRQQAGKDLQGIIAKNLQRKNIPQIEKFITYFQDNYLKSANINNKKIGLEALLSIALGFKNHQDDAVRCIHLIVKPILECFNDTQNKIRFNSIKSLFYMSKQLGPICMVVFNEIFEELIGKVADMDQEVKNAATLLSNSLKTLMIDTLPNSKDFDLKRFMRILTQKMKAMNPFIRQFLIDWINTIDQIPSVDLLVFLPQLLQDLLSMLGDKQKDVKNKADQCLNNFLNDLKKEFQQSRLQILLSEAAFIDIISILIKMAKGKQSSYTKLVTINWFQQLFQFFREQVNGVSKIKHKYYLKKVIIQRFDEILEPILSLLSHQEEEVRRAATLNNDLLLQIMEVIKKDEPINFNKVIPLLKEMLAERKASQTSDCVLTWMRFLLENYNDKILPQINDIIQKLVEKLCEGNTKTVMGIIGNVSFTQQYFDLVIDKLLSLIYTRGPQLKIEQVFRKFCSLLNVQQIYRSVCNQILSFKDPRFIDQIVHVLNYILVTFENTAVIRKKLRNLQQSNNQDLFRTLYKAFCYNPVCLVCLCFLAEEYQIAYRVLLMYSSERQISPGVLIQFCKLVNLLESANFIYLRVQMLQKHKYPYLLECIYALMMILPQGRIFDSLKNRIDVINHAENLECKNGKVFRTDVSAYISKFEEVLRILPQ